MLAFSQMTAVTREAVLRLKVNSPLLFRHSSALASSWGFLTQSYFGPQFIPPSRRTIISQARYAPC